MNAFVMLFAVVFCAAIAWLLWTQIVSHLNAALLLKRIGQYRDALHAALYALWFVFLLTIVLYPMFADMFDIATYVHTSRKLEA